MKKIVIMKTGDTFPAIASQFKDFEQWISSGLNVNEEQLMVKDIPRGDPLPSVAACSGVIIAGSHDMVTQNLSWSVAIEEWIPGLIQSHTPVLGICYGHQLIAKAMGGTVDYHEKGLEIGTTEIEVSGKASSDKLFGRLPEKFHAHVCHSQTIVQLPDTAIRIAKNSFEPHQAFRIGEFAWGVQFHPEYNEEIMTGYLDSMKPDIKASGLDLSELKNTIKPTPVALKILQRFGELAC